ncbi:MAG TPA: ATP-dependent protease ATPase subunit HslU [Planctomycetota bacterium]|nr:ATP-dependent protease ATPase subunit HslU [Planctomycetota bacterium]
MAASADPSGLRDLTPRQIVAALDRHIVGQAAAKRAVAVALRNRWRRQRLPAELRDEVAPKNILMVGPTGVGKTEVARRLAGLVGAPFIKVEATKYTEVGYVGRDVESMIRDLVKAAVSEEERAAREAVREQAAAAAEDRLLDALLPAPRSPSSAAAPSAAPAAGAATRERLRKKLRAGELDSREVEVEVRSAAPNLAGLFSGMGDAEAAGELQDAMESMMPRRSARRKLSVAEARRLLAEECAADLVDREAAVRLALDKAQNLGIVFIDEIDKVVGRSSGGSGPDVSREGVQRDLLPFIEGASVSTRWGMVRTDHILFIAAGAFSQAKPSDLMPELQGRLPIRVELKPLGVADFERILTEPAGALTKQAAALMATEGVALTFKPEAIRRIAEIAAEANARAQNTGARRLATVMEKLLEDLSFDASERSGEKVVVDRRMVDERLAGIVEDADVTRFIL